MQDMINLSNADWKPSSSIFICNDAHRTSLLSSNEEFSVFNWYCVPRIPQDGDDPLYITRSTFQTGTNSGGELELHPLKNIVKVELANRLPRGGISAPRGVLDPDYMHHSRQRMYGRLTDDSANLIERNHWLLPETYLLGQIIAVRMLDFCCILGAARARGPFVTLHGVSVTEITDDISTTHGYFSCLATVTCAELPYESDFLRVIQRLSSLATVEGMAIIN
jgi:hypothetical protein